MRQEVRKEAGVPIARESQRWSLAERQQHIKVLELKTAFLAIKTLTKHEMLKR